MNVSIVIPVYKPDLELIRRINSALKKQKFKGKKEVIIVNKNLGLADSINYGVRKAKYPLVITLHQDCIPSSPSWLKNLTEVFKDKTVVASVSKVHLPEQLWNSFDFIAKILSVKEQHIITPLLDEKGCAYRKSVLLSTGLFDGKTFRTAGEDFDMYIKLKKLGTIVYPDAKVIHNHYYTWDKRMKKEFQLSNAFGTLVRLYGRELPGWYKGIVKAIPILGWPTFWLNFPYRRMPLGGITWIFLSLIVNIIYSYGFWKGFLMGRQTA